ncbi:biopolymer transporter ExbD [Gammaproteobacteria bacterium]|uniref:Biopolymer transporter ExbD n=1 Tax=OM182 bacterium MED-G28 TaxID=1986256 RepID=A0A2A5WGM7_9GAMM|nr:biopolymer transporter ExbD [Gammaproteobacteria bacterium]MDC0221450.1 biopolymer transporter ExbD [Gammaproteobacteria bacterium]PDH35276.1 MAG: biopolymer transporter ExbD [OM182 bacterium MED-G28]
MKFKRTLREELSINITPLIDVVFLLLIFFMLTTTFSRETRLLINLPEANADIAENQSPQIEITVAREGGYTINGRALINSRLETLMRGLELESGGDLNVPIILIADAEATHQSVVTAMDAISQSGFTRMNIATQHSEDLERTTVDPTSF